jgi:hypothetical protein
MANATRGAERALLDKMYKNVKMGSDSLINIMNRVSDEGLRRELTSQLTKYEDYAKQVSKRIYDCGGTPREENVVAKMSAKMGMAMNTMTDSTTSHLAEMVIQGATMGMTDMRKNITEFSDSDVSPDTITLAKDIATFEDNSVEKLKKFL